ncbi:TnpV protein [Chakrabartyella piscis]|uniref:TnpV protein n=1 Tax=Chakrabartyella piscis TaxID=2918914 RepID=UPI002958DB4D|nr:TnpV protein [Chakrabartyella piscis]
MKELEKEIYDENNGLWYTLADDGCYYPNLELPKEDNTWVGKYGLMRKIYLIEHKNWYYMHLYLSGKLNQHLADVNEQAQAQVDQMVTHWAKLNGVDENLKAANQMEWVGRMNNYQMMAEEVVLREIIFI